MASRFLCLCRQRKAAKAHWWEWGWQGGIFTGTTSSKKKKEKYQDIHTWFWDNRFSLKWFVIDWTAVSIITPCNTSILFSHGNLQYLPSGWNMHAHPIELDLTSVYDVKRYFKNVFLVLFSLLLLYAHQLEACSSVITRPIIMKTHEADLKKLRAWRRVTSPDL